MFFKRKKPKTEPTADKSNSRGQYRKRNSKSQPLEASLTVGGWDPLRVELLDLSVRGAAVRVPFTQDRNLKIDDVVQLTISSMMRTEVVSSARVANVSADGDSHIRYGLEFTNLAGLYSQLDGFYARHFNRRKHLRVLPSLDRRIHALLRYGSEELRVPVFDVSEGGLGLTLSKDGAARIADLREIDVEFELPGADAPIVCRAQIRHRTPVKNNILVGLVFTTEGAKAIGERIADVRAFVAQRTAEIALWEKNWG